MLAIEGYLTYPCPFIHLTRGGLMLREWVLRSYMVLSWGMGGGSSWHGP